jgi:creatinine amidohydrolase
LTLPAPAVIANWVAVGEGVARAGVRKLLIFNSHGGQASLLDIAARELRTRCNLIVYGCNWWNLPLGDAVNGLFTPDEHRFGVHAGEIETSLMLALRPDLVRMQQAQDFPSTSRDRAARYPILGNGRSAKLGWAMQDYNVHGAAGNAAAASEEKGRAVLGAAARELAQLLAEISALPLSTLVARPAD